MTTMKLNPSLKESINKEKNYQLNMEILSSLKPLPGKVVNLQSEKFILKNEEINKKVIFPEEKYTTSSSISKEILYDPFTNEVEKNQKNTLTSNSVFKPVACYPIKRTTMNYYNLGTIMSFPDFLQPNPTPFSPLKITNSSFSKNSFYPVVNTDSTLINPISQINPINNINTFNPISPFFPNFTQVPLINEQIYKKNDFIQTKNNLLLNKKRNLDNENNITFNLKESEKKVKEFNVIKINDNAKINNIPKSKNTFFCIKTKKEDGNLDKKIKFTVIAKSSYVYRKRKPRKKKFLSNIKNKFICGHVGCDGLFKTKKQLVFHHYKMNIDCYNDTINLLKMINSVKEIFLKKNNQKEEKISEHLSELYKETMKKISLDEHIEALVGFNFNDEVNSITD